MKVFNLLWFGFKCSNVCTHSVGKDLHWSVSSCNEWRKKYVFFLLNEIKSMHLSFVLCKMIMTTTTVADLCKFKGKQWLVRSTEVCAGSILEKIFHARILVVSKPARCRFHSYIWKPSTKSIFIFLHFVVTFLVCSY